MEFETVVQRIRAEFNEMPGLMLTMSQAARLWGLDPKICQAVVEILVRREFLQVTSSGSILRTSHN
jgi:hypothetical protein